MASKKEYYPSGNCRVIVRKRIPAVINGNKVVSEARPSVSYTFVKLSAIVSGNKMTNVPNCYTEDSVLKDIKKFCPDITIEEVRTALERAEKNPRNPLWPKEEYLRRTQGENAAASEAEVQRLTVEVEEYKKKVAELEAIKGKGK